MGISIAIVIIVELIYAIVPDKNDTQQITSTCLRWRKSQRGNSPMLIRMRISTHECNKRK